MDILGNQEKIKGDNKLRKVKESGDFDYSVMPDSKSENQDAKEKPKSLSWIKIAVATLARITAGPICAIWINAVKYSARASIPFITFFIIRS